MSNAGGEARLTHPTWGVGDIDKSVIIPVALIATYLIIIPSFSPIPWLGPYNEKRTLQVSILLLIIAGFFFSEELRRAWIGGFLAFPRVGRWGLAVVLGLGTISSALAPAPFYALLELGHFVALFVVAGVVASLVRVVHPELVKVVFLLTTVAGTLLYTVPFSVSYGMHLTMEDMKLWPWGWTNFANYRFLNQYQTWTLPLLAGTVLSIPKQKIYLRSGVFALAVFWWILIFASEAEGTILALGIATVGVGLLFGKRVWKWGGLLLVAAFLGWIGYEVLFSTAGGGGGKASFGEQLTRNSSYGRIDHWRICLELFIDNPILGAGPMHFAWPPYQFTLPASPHSAFFQWLGEWGGPSTVIMSGLTIWGGWRWIKHERTASISNERADPVTIALIGSVLAAGAHAQVSGIVLHPLSQMLLVFVGGWAWGRYQRRHSVSEEEDAAWMHSVLCVLLVAITVILGIGLRDLSLIEERRAAYKQASEKKWYAPRYWQQGYIGVRDSSVIKRARRDR